MLCSNVPVFHYATHLAIGHVCTCCLSMHKAGRVYMYRHGDNLRLRLVLLSGSENMLDNCFHFYQH